MKLFPQLRGGAVAVINDNTVKFALKPAPSKPAPSAATFRLRVWLPSPASAGVEDQQLWPATSICRCAQAVQRGAGAAGAAARGGGRPGGHRALAAGVPGWPGRLQRRRGAALARGGVCRILNLPHMASKPSAQHSDCSSAVLCYEACDQLAVSVDSVTFTARSCTVKHRHSTSAKPQWGTRF